MMMCGRLPNNMLPFFSAAYNQMHAYPLSAEFASNA